jgi:hypothetical protein
MTGHDEPTGPTAQELLEAARRAQNEFDRLCWRVFHTAAGILEAQGRLALPPQLVQAVDAAEDARQDWMRRVDELRRRMP